jgi:hypothetical protein
MLSGASTFCANDASLQRRTGAVAVLDAALFVCATAPQRSTAAPFTSVPPKNPRQHVPVNGCVTFHCPRPANFDGEHRRPSERACSAESWRV